MTLSLVGTVRRGSFFHNIDLRVERGEVFGIVGRNGAGKSTLLHTIAGLIGLSDGELSVNGTVWDNPSSHTWLEPGERSCGVVFQDLRLFPRMTVMQNISFGLRSRGIAQHEATDRATVMMQSVGLDVSYSSRNVQQLSGGERQRVALARALVLQPEVLLLDEPFTGVDQHSLGGLRNLLKEVVAEFSGYVVLVSHNQTDIETISSRTLMIQ